MSWSHIPGKSSRDLLFRPICLKGKASITSRITMPERAAAAPVQLRPAANAHTSDKLSASDSVCGSGVEWKVMGISLRQTNSSIVIHLQCHPSKGCPFSGFSLCVMVAVFHSLMFRFLYFNGLWGFQGNPKHQTDFF